MIVVQNAIELADIFERAAHQLRAQGEHATDELADVLYARAVALAEKAHDRTAERVLDLRERSIQFAG